MSDVSLDKRVHFFSSCFPVKGVNRSVIYDVQRNNFEYIPNNLFDIIVSSKNQTIDNILSNYDNDEDKETLREYFEFLNQNEYVFFSKLDNKYFPDYDISFFKPYSISTLIIDVSDFNEDLLSSIKNQIFSTGVECLIFRFIKSTEEVLIKILDFFNDIPTRVIQLFIDNSIKIDNKNFDSFMEKNNRISIIVKHSSKSEKFKFFNKGFLINTKQNIIFERQVVKDISDFYINQDLFMESKLFNNYFNRRVYINLEGNISRWEHDSEQFGNIKETNLLDVLSNKDFKKYWNIKKDDIEICNECEYRYMCVDSRLPLYKNDKNLWVLEGECNYNPYTSEWKSNL